jgi:4-diphosphocytidyl-2-C-methyl-D-erythritol kinase
MIHPVCDSVQELITYLRAANNDLEKPALELAPVIGDVLDALKGNGALLARMSGSGATCFGMFEADANAQSAAAAMTRDYPDWWIRATRLASRNAGLPRPLIQ